MQPMSPNQAFSCVNKPVSKTVHVWDYCDCFTFLLESPQSFTPNNDLSLDLLIASNLGTCLPKAVGFSPLGRSFPEGGATGTPTFPLATSSEGDCWRCMESALGGSGVLCEVAQALCSPRRCPGCLP